MATEEKKSTGTRYTDIKKRHVVMFYNARAKVNKRGATKATLEHFGVSYVALKGWLKKYGSAKDAVDTTNAIGGFKPNKAAAKAFAQLAKLKVKELSVMSKIIKSFQ